MSERLAASVLKQYKRWISPLFPPACRYVPTCSEYAAEAVARHGVLRGGLLSLWRLVRCNPFVHGGFDPVPNKVASGQWPVARKDHEVSGATGH